MATEAQIAKSKKKPKFSSRAVAPVAICAGLNCAAFVLGNWPIAAKFRVLLNLHGN